MSSTHLTRRYWNSVTRSGSDAIGTPRARAGYTLLQRYWASLTHYRLPELPIDRPGADLVEEHHAVARDDSAPADGGAVDPRSSQTSGAPTARFAVGSEVSEALAQARSDTDRWIFKGGTGAYTRVVTLPQSIRQANRLRRELLVRMEILDPTDMMACARYARLHQSLADSDDDDADTWTGTGTQIELYATILAAFWYKQRSDLLDIEIALSSAVSIFSWDLSSRFLIMTSRGTRFPAMIVEKGQPYYDLWSIELRTSFGEARKVPMNVALTVPLGADPTIAEVRVLFEVLGLDLPIDYTDADIEMIIEKALHDSNPFLHGAGDNQAGQLPTRLIE